MTSIDFVTPHERALSKITGALKENITDAGLVRTGKFRDSVEEKQSVEPDRIRGEVGFFDPLMADRARLFEYGTDTMPGHYLMARAIDKVADRAADEIADSVFQQLDDALGW